MTKNRRRNIRIEFFVSPEENEIFLAKYKASCMKNKSAFYRKLILDGYIIVPNFELSRKLIFELNKIGTNLNQIAKVANTYGHDGIFSDDLKTIRKGIEDIWQQLILNQ